MTTTEAMLVNTNNTTVLATKQPFFQMTPAMFRQFVLLVNIIISPLICLVGVVGNSIGLVVLSKDKNKKQMTIYTYILLLLVADNLYLSIGFLGNILDGIEYFDFYLGNLLNRHVWMYKGYTLTWLKHILSVLLLLMSTERLMSLVCPFSQKNSYITKYPKTITFICALLFAAYLVPWSAGFRTVPFLNEQNRTVYKNIITPSHYDFFISYTYIETTILHYLFPVTVIIINVTTVIAYSRFIRQRSSNLKSGQSNDNQLKITVVVLSVASLYVALSLPFMFIQTLIFIDEDYTFYGRFRLQFFVFQFTGALLARINSAMDFLIYIVISSRYRAILNAMFFEWRRDSTQKGKSVSSRTASTGVVSNS